MTIGIGKNSYIYHCHLDKSKEEKKIVKAFPEGKKLEMAIFAYWLCFA